RLAQSHGLPQPHRTSPRSRESNRLGAPFVPLIAWRPHREDSPGEARDDRACGRLDPGAPSPCRGRHDAYTFVSVITAKNDIDTMYMPLYNAYNRGRVASLSVSHEAITVP